MKVKVNKNDTETLMETVIVELELPKDEKLARNCHGQAGSGSDFLCTYCDASRKTVSKPPYLLTVILILERTIRKLSSSIPLVSKKSP